MSKYIETHPKSKMANTYNCYEAFARDVLFNEKGEWERVNEPGIFNTQLNWKQVLEKYFQVSLPSF